MKSIALLIKRELSAYLKTPMGYIIVAIILCLDGLHFNAFAMDDAKFSSEVLEEFLHWCFGTTIIASVFLSMRLIAEEKQTGTLTLLLTSPIKEYEIILGKYFSALIFLSGMMFLSIYMPLLIFVNGKVSIGHILCGYLGLFLVGAASLSIGVFSSTVAKNQIVAVVLSGSILATFVMCWLLSSITEPPLKDLFSYLAFYNKHFINFRQGILHTRDVIFYVSISYFFLLLSTHVLQARRWRS